MRLPLRTRLVLASRGPGLALALLIAPAGAALAEPTAPIVFADSNLAAAGDSSLAPTNEAGPADLGLPSPSVATTGSLLCTIVPIGAGLALASGSSGSGGLLATTGLVFGPLAGYVYGGCSQRGLSGTVVRIGVAGAGTIVTLWIAGSGGGAFENESIGDLAVVTIYVTSAVVAGFAAYDIVAVGRHVRVRNEERARVGLGFAPVLLGGRPVPAVALVASF